MPIIVAKPSSFTKGSDHIIKISRAAIHAVSKVQTDPYYSNIDNWNRIVFNFKSTTHNEIEVVTFDGKVPEPEGIFSVSNRAVNSFYLKSIVIHDFDEGVLNIDNAEMPADDVSLSFTIDFPIVIPSNPTLTGIIAEDKITLSWLPESSEPYYHIWKKVGANIFTEIENGYSEHEYIDGDVIGNNTYSYYVVFEYEEDNYISNTIILPTVKPSVPSGFKAVYTGGQTVLTWNSVPTSGDGIVYRIFRKAEGDNSSQFGSMIYEGPDLTFTDTNSSPTSDYRYYVKSYNGQFNSDVSEVLIRPFSFKIDSISPDSTTSAAIDFATASPETSYQLFYKRTTDPSYAQIGVSDNQTISGLTAGAEYQFYTKAFIASMNSTSYTSPVFTKTMPYTPTIALTADAGDTKVNLSWIGSANITTYKIFHKLTSSGSYPSSPTATFDNTVTSYVVTGLTNNTSYTFMVEAIAVDGAVTTQAIDTKSSTPIPIYAQSAMVEDTRTITASDPETHLVLFVFSNQNTAQSAVIEIYSLDETQLLQTLNTVYTSPYGTGVVRTDYVVVSGLISNTGYKIKAITTTSTGGTITDTFKTFYTAWAPPSDLSATSNGTDGITLSLTRPVPSPQTVSIYAVRSSSQPSGESLFGGGSYDVISGNLSGNTIFNAKPTSQQVSDGKLSMDRDVNYYFRARIHQQNRNWTRPSNITTGKITWHSLSVRAGIYGAGYDVSWETQSPIAIGTYDSYRYMRGTSPESMAPFLGGTDGWINMNFTFYGASLNTQAGTNGTVEDVTYYHAMEFKSGTEIKQVSPTIAYGSPSRMPAPAVNISGNDIIVSWGSHPPMEGLSFEYHVMYRHNGGSWMTAASNLPANSSYTLPNASSGTWEFHIMIKITGTSGFRDGLVASVTK